MYMRKNFIPGEDEISVIYEDISGHGTSVAGLRVRFIPNP